MFQRSNHFRNKIAYRFKRWTGKSYSAFNSLKMVVNVGVIDTIISEWLALKNNCISFTHLKNAIEDSVIIDLDSSPDDDLESVMTAGDITLVATPVICDPCLPKQEHEHQNFQCNFPTVSFRQLLRISNSILLDSHFVGKFLFQLIFNSRMVKKLFIISFLCLSFLSDLIAQTDTVYLDNVVIQENRIRIPFNESTRSVAILDKIKINQQPLNSLSDALSYVAGVDVRSRGAMGTQSDLSIRGSTFDENLVLLNGVKLTDPQTGHHLMNLPIGFDDIERVEVIKGAAARIYGQNAYAGAINIITKEAEKRGLYISTFGGLGVSDSQGSDTTFYDYGISLGLSLPSERYGQYISYSKNKSNGHRYNSDYDINNLYYRGSLMGGNSRLNFQIGYTWREFGANGFYSLTEEREKVNTLVTSVDYEVNAENSTHLARVYWRQNKDDYVWNWENPQWFHNVHLTNSVGAEYHYSFFSDLGNTGFGLEFRNENIRGVENEQLAMNPLLNDDERYNFGTYLEHRYTKGKFSMTPGIYINYHEDFGWNTFPGIDLGYHITDNTLVYGNFGRTYRIPTFFDLYYSSPPSGTFGNPDLKPGVANNYELGVKFKKSMLSLELNGFIIDGITTIDWVHEVGDTLVNWQAKNFDNVNKKGFEISGLIDFTRQNDGKFIRWMNINYTFIDSKLQDDQFKSRYALANLRHQFNYSLTHRITKKLSNTITTRFRSRPSGADGDILSGEEVFDNYWLIDMRLFYELKIGKIYLEVTNLADTEYIEVGQVVMPGRWLRLGAQINLDF